MCSPWYAIAEYNKHIMVSTFIRIVFCIGLILFVACKERTTKQIDSFESMGTVVYVQPGIYSHKIKNIFARVDNDMSEWKSNSPLSIVNKSAGMQGALCPVSVVEAVQEALSIAELTMGAFDPTWASMWNAWDFTKQQVPSLAEINALLPLVNWENVEVTGQVVSLKEKGMKLGLGGIAKGIALDDSRDALIADGVKNFMLQVGGQVLVHGNERVIGIRKPEGSPNELIGTVTLKNASISTSGNYEKFFMKDGTRYHHIIHPKTGYPARGLQSVTVISQDATLADALSTALFVMGIKDGITLIESLSNAEALFIDDNNVIHQSSGFTFSIMLQMDD